MRLNYDCIRDILLYIENGTDDNEPCLGFSDLVQSLPYDKNTLSYHIRRLDSANFFDNIFYSQGTIEYISNLSWEGHQFIDATRDSKIWEETKSISKKFTSVGLDLLIKISTEIISKKLSGLI